MNEQYSIENYKKEVKNILTEYHHCTEEYSNRLMNLYSDDFNEFSDDNWSPEATALLMVMHF